MVLSNDYSKKLKRDILADKETYHYQNKDLLSDHSRGLQSIYNTTNKTLNDCITSI